MSKVLELSELQWDFDSARPFLHSDEGYGFRHYVDPCPAYSHDLLLVEAEYDRIKDMAPIARPPLLYVLGYEGLSRTNGWAEEYSNEIVLSGKRIPLHPAMTRHLVSHEYGHFVEYRLKDIRDDKNLIEKYQKIRGGTLEYKPGTWHLATRELFADDFRILVSGREVDFWPHPDFPHPTKHEKIQDFWADAIEELEIESVKV